MSEKFRAGDASEWNSHGSIGRGKVKKKLTARTLLKGHAVAVDDGRFEPEVQGQQQPSQSQSPGGERTDSSPEPGRA